MQVKQLFILFLIIFQLLITQGKKHGKNQDKLFHHRHPREAILDDANENMADMILS